MAAPVVLDADDHRVGLTVVMTQRQFRKLLRLARTPDMEGWSAAIVRLVDKATP